MSNSFGGRFVILYTAYMKTGHICFQRGLVPIRYRIMIVLQGLIPYWIQVLSKYRTFSVLLVVIECLHTEDPHDKSKYAVDISEAYM